MYGVMTYEGTITAEAKYQGMCNLVHNLFTVTNTEGLSGVINHSGKQIVKLNYLKIRYQEVSGNNKFPKNKILICEGSGFTDTFTLRGKRVRKIKAGDMPMVLCGAYSVSTKGLGIFEEDGKFGIFKDNYPHDSIVLKPAIYDEISFVFHYPSLYKNPFVIIAKLGNQYGLMNNDLELIFDYQPHSIYYDRKLDYFKITDLSTGLVGFLQFTQNEQYFFGPQFEKIDGIFYRDFFYVKEPQGCFYYINKKTGMRYRHVMKNHANNSIVSLSKH